MIGVIGARGSVGSVAAAQLIAAGYPVRVGARTALLVDRLPSPVRTTMVEAMRVDVDDAPGLYRFCLGCDVVLNCAGPAARIGSRVAVAAAAADANYVDVAGDDMLYASVRDATGDRIAVISAGLNPGLSELLPRYLAASGPARPRRLTVWHGGRDRFAPAAAVDYLAATAGDSGMAGGAWRGAQVGGGGARFGVRMPFFPDPLTLFAYLSTATARVSDDLGLDAMDWFNGFAGKHIVQVLTEPAHAAAGLPAERLIRASELDLCGADPYQIMLLRSEDDCGGVRGLVVRGRGASTVTGAVAASAVDQLLRGRIPSGVHHAGFVLDPRRTMDWLLATGALVSVSAIDGDPCATDPAEDAFEAGPQ